MTFQGSKIGLIDIESPVKDNDAPETVSPKKESVLPEIISPEKREKFVVHEMIIDDSPRFNESIRADDTFAVLHTNIAASMSSIEIAPNLGNKSQQDLVEADQSQAVPDDENDGQRFTEPDEPSPDNE